VINLSSWDIMMTPPFHACSARVRASRPCQENGQVIASFLLQKINTSISRWLVGFNDFDEDAMQKEDNTHLVEK
jgi:hypothetical protein